MSKMREAFEQQWALLSHDYGKIIDSALGEYFFNAGYQAAIVECANVVDHIYKEGGGTYGDFIRKLKEDV